MFSSPRSTPILHRWIATNVTTLQKTFTSFALTTVAFAVIVAVVGVQRFLDALGNFSLVAVVAVIGVSLLGTLSRALSFHVTANRLGIPLDVRQSVPLYITVVFSNNITPFAQAGGQPIAATFIRRVSNQSYSRCLASLSALDVLDFLVSIIVFTLGGLYFLLRPGEVPELLESLAGVFSVFVAGSFLGGAVVWRFRTSVSRLAGQVLSQLLSALSFLPLIPNPTVEDLEEGVSQFFESLSTMADNPIAFTTGLALMLTSSLVNSFALFVALAGIGAPIPYGLILVAGPIAGLAAILPLPGGVGGTESVSIAILTSLSAVAVPAVTAGVIITSGVGYWIPVLLGLVIVNRLHYGTPS